MTTSHLKICYIVPTKDRPDDLATLLDSLSRQTISNDQLIIVDGSDPVIKEVVDRYQNLDITYVRVFPPSLSRQRNAGLKAVNSDVSLVGFLDDDLVLEPDATEKMLAFWVAEPPETGGAGFSIINQPQAFSNFLSSLFLIDHPKPGKVMHSGFQSQIPFVRKTIETQWLYGGATIWRKSVADQFEYDNWYIGHGYLEDVDYSFRISQDHKLFVVGGADVNHYSRPVLRSAEFKIGQQQVLNRHYFFAKFNVFSRMAFAWALFGQLLFNLLSFLRHANTSGIRRFAGNVSGLSTLLTGRQKQIGGFYK